MALHCNTYNNCKASTKRIQVHQGGSRSGKTYSICEWLIEMAWRNRNCAPSVVTVCRKTLPAAKATVMRDFLEILIKENLYREECHNKSESTYLLYSTLFEFIGIDQPQKVRGRKRHVLFMNEANEFELDDFTQLALRTTDRIILDYNPSDEFHWIYDKVLTRDDVDFFQTTFLDNPFLPEELIREIERLKDLDENYWRVFGLGERGTSRATIYTHWKLWDALPEGGTNLYGIDFGFNAPTALVQVKIKDEDLYVKELLYKPGLTNSDLLDLLPTLIPNKHDCIYADAAEPDRIEEIRRKGYNIRPADKNVKDGIDRIRRSKLYITADSANLIKEIQNYKYQQDKSGQILDQPVKFFDHAVDSMRYAVYTHNKNPNRGKYLVV